LRSSTIYLYEDEKLTGSICVNTDISDSVRFENTLRAYNGYYINGDSQNESNEHFTQNVAELLDLLIQEAQASVGVPAPLMSKEERLRFLEFIDKKGAFMITKSSERVCEFLGISKFTLYNYLETTRNSMPNNTHK
jgi:predicted transcriptional regulator YheO